MPAIDIDRDAAHDAAQRELAKPIYPRASVSQRLHDWVNELLQRFMRTSEVVPGGWLGIIALFIVLALAVTLAVRVLRRTIRARRGADYPLFDADKLSAAQHRASAEQHAAQGDWAVAIRHRLRAVARELEESGVLDPVAGRTAGELAQDAGDRRPHLHHEFAQASAIFNDVTYGALPGTAAGYHLIAGLDDHLRSRRPADSAAAQQPAVTESWARVR
ncbi:MAG: DUF4129 domain-containing protein [Mycobacterium sp.]|uniref:DUF4129 domain-containing protein n=1 Tax=Mycobacterium sp. TaxID=1785 RepID=UPI003CC5251C